VHPTITGLIHKLVAAAIATHHMYAPYVYITWIAEGLDASQDDITLFWAGGHGHWCKWFICLRTFDYHSHNDQDSWTCWRRLHGASS